MRYRRYLLIVLMIVWACNAMDNVALGLVMQNIKIDLHLSDTQLGVLTGIAVALFYSVMGIPIARWADRGNRVVILSLTATVWSALVALCGTAVNFTQLRLLRMGVGIGEAGCAPTSQSLLADYFTRAERPRATAIFLLGDALSMFMGFFVAGWVAQLYGWRAMFVVLGVPGLLVAGLVRATLREPRLAQPTGSAKREPALEAPVADAEPNDRIYPGPPNIAETTRILWSNKTFRSLVLYMSVASFFATGVLQWQPVFLMRSYGLKTGELGTWLAALNCSAVLIGRYCGGELASRFAANNERRQLKAMAITYSLSGVLSIFVYLTSNRYVSFGFMGLSLLTMNAIAPSTYATIQTLVPGRMRALATAIMFFCGALIGNGLGPLGAGALSDALQPMFGEESLRYSLLALCPGYLWGAWYLWRASLSVTRDLEEMHDPTDSRGADGRGVMLSHL